MSDTTLRCLPLRTVTDGPLFGTSEGTLSALTNMELQQSAQGMYAEARGGLDRMQPLGGTGVNAITQGGYSWVHQVCTSTGWIRTFDASAGVGAQYSANYQFHPGWYAPFPATAFLNSAIYFGSDFPFSRIGVQIYSAATWTVTLTYEYWNGANFNTALTTDETIDFTTTGTKFATWRIPTDWATTTVGDAGTGNVLKYWMRIRVSVRTAVVFSPTLNSAFGIWNGMREIYEVNADPRTSGAGAILKRRGQSGTTEEWFSVGSSLFAGTQCPSRLTSYRGRTLLVNGKDSKHWDGFSFRDLGLIAPGSGATVTPAGGALAGFGNRVTRVWIAFGYGPLTALPDGGHPTLKFDAQPMYGWSQATYVGECTTAAGVNERIHLDWAALTINSNVSALGIYITDDLTGVTTNKTIYPAKLFDSLERAYFLNITNIDLGSYGTPATEVLFPPQEAVIYDNTPPTRCRYMGVYQNRLLLGDDETWYISDAFQPDVFSTKATTGYIRLAKAGGGRNMGGIEFGDQFVLFTEDQTWGVTNIDLDTYQLFPIALNVGCVAPDAAAAGDGLLTWPARNGWYAWDGTKKPPWKITPDMDNTFQKLSYESIGGSRATIHSGRMDVRLSNPDYSSIGLAWRFRFDTGKWNQILLAGFTSTLFPVATVYAPLGNNDVGYIHPVWAKVDYGTGAGTYSLFLGELTTQDNGTNYTCSGTMHFPMPASAVASPRRVIAYYQATDGWQTPTLTLATTAPIGSSPGTIGVGTPDTADDYNVIGGTFSGVSRMTSDIKVTFSVSSQAGGTVGSQRFFGAIIEANVNRFRRGAI